MSQSTEEIRNGHVLNGLVVDAATTDAVHISESDLEPFKHQISGHGSAEKGLLRHKSKPLLLKPLQRPPMGDREVNFYNRVLNSQNEQNCYSTLSRFIPKFHGVARLQFDSTNPTLQPYLILQNILQDLRHPCVMDLKIGAVTWSPDASEAKIKQEMSKYVGIKQKLGICLTGVEYGEISDGGDIKQCKISKDECKTFDPDSLRLALGKYFNIGVGGSTTTKAASLNLIREVIKKLEKIEEVFSTQTQFKLFGSSILVAYDAEWLVSGGGGDSSPPPPVRVYMIDFAHFHETEEGAGLLDENYLFGVRNLVRILCDIFRDNQ